MSRPGVPLKPGLPDMSGFPQSEEDHDEETAFYFGGPDCADFV